MTLHLGFVLGGKGTWCRMLWCSVSGPISGTSSWELIGASHGPHVPCPVHAPLLPPVKGARCRLSCHTECSSACLLPELLGGTHSCVKPDFAWLPRQSARFVRQVVWVRVCDTSGLRFSISFSLFSLSVMVRNVMDLNVE